MNYFGIVLGAATFLIIGLCHPLVIKMEYHWGKKSWWMLLVAGIIFSIASLCCRTLLSAVLGAAAFSFFWGIFEIFEQEKRVLKGWFPENPARHPYYENLKKQNIMQPFYDFSARSLRGEELNMAAYKGKLVLVVNTASKCGFTPQLEGLQALYEKYEPQGLVILGFPCNQFASQEPGDEASIAGGCVLNYGVTFQMFSKINVNGKDTHPLYVWLKKQLPGLFGTQKIKWNFAKFLIDRDGTPLHRFAPVDTPQKIEAYLQKKGLVQG